jgi:hypothetical protein
MASNEANENEELFAASTPVFVAGSPADQPVAW